MTEAEWLHCNDSLRMLRFLAGKPTGWMSSLRALLGGMPERPKVIPSERNLWLFACACCRHVYHLLAYENSRELIILAERFAGGLISWGELTQAARYASGAPLVRPGSANSLAAAAPLAMFRSPWDPEAAEGVARVVVRALEEEAGPRGCQEAGTRELTLQCKVLRDVLRNPFRPVVVQPEWLAWHDRLAIHIARAIYDEYAFDRLPILADALEDAGCDDADILDHCRQPGEHVRGCWVVDLLLGKQ